MDHQINRRREEKEANVEEIGEEETGVVDNIGVIDRIDRIDRMTEADIESNIIMKVLILYIQVVVDYWATNSKPLQMQKMIKFISNYKLRRCLMRMLKNCSNNSMSKNYRKAKDLSLSKLINRMPVNSSNCIHLNLYEFHLIVSGP